MLPFPRLNTTIPDHLKAIETPQIEPLIDEDSEQIVNDFISVLSQSVKSRVADIPHLRYKKIRRIGKKKAKIESLLVKRMMMQE